MSDIVLKNDRLKVQVLVPGEEYCGGRYDWTGMVRQITLDDKHTFLQSEPPEPMGGRGLSGVWEFQDKGFFDECELGDKFPMMGIGLCTKMNNIFNRGESFSVQPFRRSVKTEGDYYVSFETMPTMCSGRAMYQFKELWLENNTFTIRQTVKNCGTKELDLHEFNHNFMCFDGKTIDSSYKLTTSYKPIVDVRRGMFGVETDGIRIIELDGPTASASCQIDGHQGMPENFMQIKNETTKTAVDVYEDFPIARAYNWFCEKAFCAETHCAVKLAPGEETVFTRVYSFTSSDK